MCIVHSQGYLTDDLHGFIQGDPLSLGPEILQHVPEVCPTDEVHHDEEQRAFLTKVVDLDDARVVEARGGACFLEEALAEVGLVGHMGVHNLDGDVTLQGDVASLEDCTHASLTQEVRDLVAAKRLAY